MPFTKPTIDEALSKNPARNQAVLLVDGGDKDGKTTFALTMPTPIWVINTNFGLAGLPAYEELVRQGLIEVADHALPEEFVISNYEKVMKEINADYNDALASADRVGGTVVVDKADEVWGMVGPSLKAEAERRRYEEHIAQGKDPKAFKKMQTDYSDPNLWMRSFYVRPLQGGRSKVNVAFVQGTKREWKQDGSGPTGNLLYHGFQEGPGLVQAHVRVYTTEPEIIRNDKGIPTGTKPIRTEAKILLCRFDRRIQGMVLKQPTFKAFQEELDD